MYVCIYLLQYIVIATHEQLYYNLYVCPVFVSVW